MSRKRKKHKHKEHLTREIPIRVGKEEAVEVQAEKYGPGEKIVKIMDDFPTRPEMGLGKTAARPVFLRLIGFASNFFLIVSVAALGAGAYFIFYYHDSPREVSVTLDVPDKIMTGVPFQVRAEINNASESNLQEGVLSFDVPEDIVLIATGDKKETSKDNRLEEILGEIGAKSLQKKDFTFLAVASEEGDLKIKERAIRAGLSYTLGKSGSFEAKAEKETRIEKAAITLGIQAETQVVSGSTFSIKLEYKNSAREDISSVNLKAGYPNKFRFVSASVEPNSLNNYWKFGSLKAGAKGSLVLKGNIEGAEGSVFEFPITFLGEFGGKEYPIYEEVLKVAIAPSPLGLQVFVNGSEDYVARLGDTLQYVTNYKNMSGVALQNVIVTATLRGDMISFNSVKTDGVLDMARGAVRWDSSKVPALADIAPGASGQVDFSVQVDNKYPINRFGDKNFSIQLRVEASSPSVPFYVSSDRTQAEKEVTTKIGGLVTLDARAFYRDAISGIVNSGDLPPKVGVPTQYTVHWIVRNFSTDVSSVTVRAPLQPGVSWRGNARSNVEGSAPEFNEAGREVIWEIPKIPATRGAIGEPVAAVFQIEATPDASQVGGFQPLLGATSLTAMDDFTGVTLEASDLPLSTNLVDDATVGAGQGVVQN